MTKKRAAGDTEVRVNQRFVEELIAQNTSNKRNKKTTDVEALMDDDRFKRMFEDEEFKRDPRLGHQNNQNPVSISNKFIFCTHL